MIFDWRRISHVVALLVVLTTPALAFGFEAVVTTLYWVSVAATAAITTGVSYLLQRILTPRPKPGESPVTDLQITTSREGATIPRVYGRAAVGAKVIWLGSITVRSVSQGSGKRSSPPTTAYSCSMGFLLCENRNDSVLGISRIWANGNVLYERDPATLTGVNPPIDGQLTPAPRPFRADLLYARRLQILLGQESQTTRCEWYATSGDDDDYPGYRGSVTVWLDDVDLTPSYNQIAQYQFEVVNSDGSIAEIVTAECAYAGVSAAQITNGAPVEGVNGWIISGPTPPKSTFEALSIVEPFDCAEVDGKLKFISQPQSSSVTIPDGDLGAVSTGREEQTDKAIKFALSSEQSLTEVAQRVEITFFDPDFQYEEATAGYGLQFGSGAAVKEIFLPMASDRTQMRNKASRLLARTRMETDSLKVELPPKYVKYHPGDVVTIPAPNSQLLDMRILNMEFIPGDKVKIEGVRQLRAAGVGPSDADIVTPGESDTVPPLDTIFILSNAPPLVDDHDGFDGIYWAAGPRNVPTTTPPAGWTGATLFRNACGSDDSNKQYYPLALTRAAAVIGKARTALANGSGIDATNTVDIDFPYGAGTNTVLGIHNDAFTKVTQANLCILGKEVLQFRDVADVSASYSLAAGRVWRLSQLKRGIRDTSAMTGTHAINEGFVLYNPDTLHRVPIDIIEQDLTWSFKSLSLGQQETDADPAFFEYDPDDGTLLLMETP
jgi:hypothetical protein